MKKKETNEHYINKKNAFPEYLYKKGYVSFINILFY